MSVEVVHVVGARPNFPKMAPVYRALGELEVSQMLVHTGQHYDDRLSDVFFSELGIPKPDVNLSVGSGSHAEQTAAVMVGLERFFIDQRPSLIVVYGDVNSTLAAALVGSKLLIPVAHVEAGLRSGDMTMPEEVNRKVTDQVASLLFVTSEDGVKNLRNEGVAASQIHFVGNTMIDTLLAVKDKLLPLPVLARLAIDRPFILATLHRPANVDDPHSARRAVAVLRQAAKRAPVILPLHPRGRASLQLAGLDELIGVTVCDPLTYLEFTALLSVAQAVVTDSGGVQEESTMLGIACLTLRPNTERPVTITQGTNRLVTPETFAAALDEALAAHPTTQLPSPDLWDGHAGERIATVVLAWLKEKPLVPAYD